MCVVADDVDVRPIEAQECDVWEDIVKAVA